VLTHKCDTDPFTHQEAGQAWILAQPTHKASKPCHTHTVSIRSSSLHSTTKPRHTAVVQHMHTPTACPPQPRGLVMSHVQLGVTHLNSGRHPAADTLAGPKHTAAQSTPQQPTPFCRLPTNTVCCVNTQQKVGGGPSSADHSHAPVASGVWLCVCPIGPCPLSTALAAGGTKNHMCICNCNHADKSVRLGGARVAHSDCTRDCWQLQK
jgi:hypothetical protein